MTCPIGAQYDIIICNHVLEHTVDPASILNSARTHLSPGGVLHLAVPNVRCPEAVFPGWNCYEPYHVLYFSPQSLMRAIVEARLRVLYFGTTESFSGWFLALLRTAYTKRAAGVSQDRRSGRKSSLVQHIYYGTMSLFGVATWPLRRLQAALGFGDELVMIAATRS